MINKKMQQIILERKQLDNLISKYGIRHSEVLRQSGKVDKLATEIHALQLKDIIEENEILRLS